MTNANENAKAASAIPIDVHAVAHINTFWDEFLADVGKRESEPKVSVLAKKNIFIMAEKAYRMGVARERAAMKNTKDSYDKMARLTGTLIGAMFDVGRATTLEEAQLAAKRTMEGEKVPTIDEINEQRASFAYGQLALTSRYHDAPPAELEHLRTLCRRTAGCKDA